MFEQKDFGVILDTELKFDEHMSVKMKKENAMFQLIRRSFSYLDDRLSRKLFTPFARPHLEHGQIIWVPYLKKNVIILENVQCRTTKLADGFHCLSHSERLRKLNLPLLVYRRARGDMDFSKHFYSYENCKLTENFRPRKSVSRKHNY